MNDRIARAPHAKRATLLVPTDREDPPITETKPAPEDTCPRRIPGTDIRCTRHTHPPESACTASGSRNGVRFNAVFWREDPRP
jgi:hypothetical protein